MAMESSPCSFAEADPYQSGEAESCQAGELEHRNLSNGSQPSRHEQFENSEVEGVSSLGFELRRRLGTAPSEADNSLMGSSFTRNVRPRLHESGFAQVSLTGEELSHRSQSESDSMEFSELQQKLKAFHSTRSQKEDSAFRHQHPVDYRALLPERYEVDVKECYDMDVALLGKGGYGKVVVARDKSFGGRVVAIKQVVKKSKRHAEAFHAEARIMRELDHPNICRLFEVFECGKNIYFVMELCAGGHLFARLAKQGKIPEKDSAHILSQVAGALRYAHDRQIAHRDLKPDNICFANSDKNDMHVKVIDWGLSAIFIEKRMLSVCGTVSYAAPEILSLWGISRDERDPYGCACDIWSLGVISYIMLSGRPPFGGERSKMLEKMKLAEYTMGGEWVSISDAAKDFVRFLLQPDPGKRPSSAEAVLHPWLTAFSQAEESEPSAEVCADALANMKKFSRLSHFRSLCIALVAQQLDSSHLQDMQRLFQSLDTSGDGVLSVEEVKNGFSKILGASCIENSKMDEVFKAMDLDGSGAIDYTEFVAAGLCSRMSTQDEALWAAFRSMDRDSSGSLTSEDITSMLSKADAQHTFSGRNCNALAKEVVKKCDQDKSGTIDFQEFCAFITSTPAPSPGTDQSPMSLGADAFGFSSPLSDAAPIPTPDCLKTPLADAELDETKKKYE